MRKLIYGVIGSTILFTGLVALQQDEIPPTRDPNHSGPEWCQREGDRFYKANCTECSRRCKKNDPEGEDSKCKTYCRKGSCKCHPECES